jgi:uncharacterized surface protein with fasciclin (FAS1) repeats
MFKYLATAILALSLAACAGQNGQMSGSGMDGGMNGGDQMAKADKSIVEIASGDERFSTLVTAVKKANLAGTLDSGGPFTVFAPTNAAFDKLPQDQLNALLQPENRDKLRSILTYHVVPGRVMAGDIAGKQLQADTVNGAKLPIDATGGSVSAGNATVIKTDIKASNGVIHVVDSVILPN